MTLHTYTHNQCPYHISTSYTLGFLRYPQDKLLPATRPPAHVDTIGENNTHTALKSCGEMNTFENANFWGGKVYCFS